MPETILEKIAEHKAAIAAHEQAILDIRRTCVHVYVIDRQQAHEGLDGERTFNIHSTCSLCGMGYLSKRNPAPKCVDCTDVAMDPVSEEATLSGETVRYRCPTCGKEEENFWHLTV